MGSSFEDLEVWKKSCRLSVRLYKLLRDCRDYGMKDQMLRSSISISSNIKVYKYCTRIGCGAENTGLYFTRG